MRTAPHRKTKKNGDGMITATGAAAVCPVPVAREKRLTPDQIAHQTAHPIAAVFKNKNTKGAHP